MGLVAAYGVFTTHFAKSPDSTFQAEKMKEEISLLQQEKAKLAYQFEDFRQNAAMHWPEARKGDYRWPASVSIDLSTSLYEKGRRLFQEKQWAEAKVLFTQLLNEFPYSKWVAEAQYYSCEITFQEKDFKKTADCVSQMVEIFPESALTGFQLMRLAQIHEMNGQQEEAIEVYRIIQSQFSEPLLKTQSSQSLQRLEER